jgi:hypothetical protein
MIQRTTLTGRLGAVAILASLLALAACAPSASPSASASGQPSTSASQSASAAPSASTPESVPPSDSASEEPSVSLPEFSCVPSFGLGGTTALATISDVRVGTHDGFDRIVFEFDSGIPALTVEAALPPFFQDASGLPLTVNGTAFLKITMAGTSRATVDGVLLYDGPTELSPAFPRLVHLVMGGDFERVSSWYAGLDGGSCLRVFTLDGNTLVIDIEH